MQYLDNIISADEIETFKKYFEKNYNKKYTNWETDNQLIDHRLNINTFDPEFDIIRDIVSQHFDNPVKIWSAYQRQSNPHAIHIDDFGSDQQGKFRYTYILAMDTVPEFKAIVWKETCWDNKQLHEFVNNWGETRLHQQKKSNISETEDLEHTFDSNQNDYMSDYLSLDGIYQYRAGTACLFDATQLHCTSNWKKYKKFDHRELLQIHVISNTEID